MYEQTDSCPLGWTGKADEGSCYKVNLNPVTNSDAALLCNQDGAEIVQIRSSDEDTMVARILEGFQDFALPLSPGFYHIGTYQRQDGNQYYHRNGVKV